MGPPKKRGKSLDVERSGVEIISERKAGRQVERERWVNPSGFPFFLFEKVTHVNRDISKVFFSIWMPWYLSSRHLCPKPLYLDRAFFLFPSLNPLKNALLRKFV